MSMDETLGVPAHCGGLVVDRPELRVGVLNAVCRPTGVELELIARRPVDRRSATRRQADIRAGRGAPAVAPRRLLPPFDEGVDLRVGWLDQGGRAHWVYGSYSSSSGDHAGGSFGPSLRTAVAFPPLYDRVSVVLAWPEIGFAETVVELSLPDRATVDRDTVSIWDAPVDTGPVPDPLNHRVAAPVWRGDLAIETGRVVAAPRVLNRVEHAVVALTRLSAVGDVLSIEILSVATEERGRAVFASVFPPRPPSGGPDDVEQVRTGGSGAAVAVLRDRDAAWVRPYEAESTGGNGAFRTTAEFRMKRPGDGVLDLVVGWPAAGIPDACVAVPLTGYPD
jgi:hypothetical protein